ncbi:hypothetical protein BVH01_10460 [Pseudomonas sp. PA1(2017)]|uniref:hypothetical protein n=1 Tax=Pseudomonas sp. PA1(2017) TaxID=1932113 RepID=UPI00095CE57E|nr:hypothetical protein [Pseudomonas sp. PA1(2017)]OLU16976.1 hypothetical protein BVH01_10460 [Pseudomonas sp. PA1(2017)]
MRTSHGSQSLKINLDYYKGHESLLATGAYKTLDTAKRVEGFQKHGLIPLSDFLNYFLIRRQENPNYKTYLDRLNHIDKASMWLEDILDINTTINWKSGSNREQEGVGEAVSLSVANSLFGLTAADWTTIPEQKGRKAHPTFDFEQTLVGITSQNSIVQIESKGSFVQDNTLNSSAVSSHARNIVKKKTSIASKGTAYKHPAMAMYGMIAAIDPMNEAKCWLLDPPADFLEGNPRDIKVATRLEYVASIVSMLAPTAKLPHALLERAKLWREGAASKKVESLEGHPFTGDNYVETYLAKSKILMKDQDIVGQVYVGESGKIFFLGLRGDLVRAAIKQEPDAIINARFLPSEEKTDFIAEPLLIRHWKKGSPRKVSITLYTASSGVVIGLPS